MTLTHSHEQKQDAKNVDHGEQRHRQRCDDLAERRHAAEEAHDAEGAEDAHDARVLIRNEERQDGHGDDEGIQLTPHVGYEGPEPVRQSVDGKLNGEDHGEEVVQIVKEISGPGVRAVLFVEQGDEFRLENRAPEVLSHMKLDQRCIARVNGLTMKTMAWQQPTITIRSAIMPWNFRDSYRFRTLS